LSKENIDDESATNLGQADQMAGNVPEDKSTTSHGPYDEFLGQSPSALAGAKDVVASDVDAACRSTYPWFGTKSPN
jgi:hypothetical protein